jgi:hypothetical protein
MSSKRAKEGYLMIDHRASYMPVPDEVMLKDGLPAGSGKGLFEAPTYTCSHCQYVVVINPKRTRERAYCRGCDSYICDGCGVLKKNGAPCKTYMQFIDEVATATERNLIIVP